MCDEEKTEDDDSKAIGDLLIGAACFALTFEVGLVLSVSGISTVFFPPCSATPNRDCSNTI